MRYAQRREPAVAAGCGVAAAAATEISSKVTLDWRRFLLNGMACLFAEVVEVAEVPVEVEQASVVLALSLVPRNQISPFVSWPVSRPFVRQMLKYPFLFSAA